VIELDPDSSDAYGYYAWYLAPMGRMDEAVAQAERGRQADPLGMLANFAPGSVLVFRRQGDKAIQSLRAAISLDPNYWFDYCFLGRAYE
jgi:tetratricopeptide (TPR) repeat protein